MQDNIGENIKAARKNKGLTQRELGKKIGKQYSTVQKYENGVIEPPVSVIKEIAAALECDPYSLMSFDMASDALSNRINAQERVDAALAQLNDAGMEKAAEAIEIIAEVARYRRNDNSTVRSPAPEAGTTPEKKPPESP